MKTFLALILLMFHSAHVEADDTVQVVIETRILEGDPQAGMKSRHVIQVDFSSKQVQHIFETGTTDFFGIELQSARDNFVVSGVNFSDDTASFKVIGETASGTRVLPNIDYSFSMTVNRDGSATVSGCHDGYPAYSIVVEGKSVYAFKHKPIQLLSLFGSCDVKV
ncbi:DUF3238 domain-containing protein [Pelagibius sp. Alg239-R121]|uniref:DUF3238 domain-containing protein n=1 Tax=Pelagibius sp. Alg239-R121 TaxID=2993448 RepID=UPI0024A73CB9|nr:DUF3238 domain-containing protein [Pelagibius sp. Alg239-R121]